MVLSGAFAIRESPLIIHFQGNFYKPTTPVNRLLVVVVVLQPPLKLIFSNDGSGKATNSRNLFLQFGSN
jgi:hypothetical protein